MKIAKIKLLHFLFIQSVVTFLLASSVSCDKKPVPDPSDTDPDYEAKEMLRDGYIPYYYFWNDKVTDRNSKLDIKSYDIYDLFDACLYEKDRWSWMCDKEYFKEMETGVISGTYGMSLGQPIKYYNDYSIMVKYVYPGSPMDKNGVTRGWKLTHLAGTEVMALVRNNTFNKALATSPQDFTFINTNGEKVSFRTEAAMSLQTRSVLMTDVFTKDDYQGLPAPVGYMMYLSFNANMTDDIDKAMKEFGGAGVQYLILDLRYNGGGDVSACEYLANRLAPASAHGDVFVEMRHNSNLKDYDKVTDFNCERTSMGFKAVYFITGTGSASSSEVLINGLRDKMDIKMVGDTTYGKPNGMYVLMYPGSKSDYEKYNKGDYSKLEYAFLPICFYNYNGNGRPIPDEGFAPDNYRPDDMYHDFGILEDNINACLEHICKGAFPSTPIKCNSSSEGIDACLADESKNAHYGIFKASVGALY